MPLEPALEGPPGFSLGLPGPLLTVACGGPGGVVLVLFRGISIKVPEGEDCDEETEEVDSYEGSVKKQNIYVCIFQLAGIDTK